MKHIEIFSNATKARLEEKTNGVLIETDGRVPKTCSQVESRGRKGGGRTHRAPKALVNEISKLDPRIKTEIREAGHENESSQGGAIAAGGQGGGGGEGGVGRRHH